MWIPGSELLVYCFMSAIVSRVIGNHIGYFVGNEHNNFGGMWRSYVWVRMRLDVQHPIKKDMKAKKGERIEILKMQKPKHRQIDSTILNATYTMKPPSTTTIYSSMTLTRPTSASSFLHPNSNTASPSQNKNNKKKKNTMEKSSPVLWDCDSSLYDSYELKSFKQHLDSAINYRSLSMPHLPARRIPPPPAENLPPLKNSSRLSRSLSRFLRSLFRRKPKRKSASEIVETESGNVCLEGEECCDLSGYSLWTIPEVPETYVQFSPPSPELNSVSRRAVSDRFTKFSLIQHRF